MTDATITESVFQPEENDLDQRVALLVEYCGSGFHGCQYQPNQPTVQHEIQVALGQLNLQTSAVSFASRTDSGVHALGQVAHFDIAHNTLANIPDLASALNAVLPQTVSVRAVNSRVTRAFNSRRDTAAKWYRYKIYNCIHRSVWAASNAALHYRPSLDVERMSQAASLLLGEHDFTSFKDFGSQVIDDICRVEYINVDREGDFIIFDIAADRFLYKMVRNIVGQLMVIGRASNPHPPEAIIKVLTERDRRKAAPSAPPDGLTLMAIQYKSPFNLFENDVYVKQFKNNLKSMESLHNENLFRKAS